MTGKDSTNAQRPDLCPNSDDTIHVVLAVYDPSGTYSQHAGVVMTSIFENTHSKVTVHILHDDTLTEDNRRKFLRTAEKYSQGIELHDVMEYRKRIGNYLEDFFAGHYTVGMLYKLTIHDIIPFTKVIYLDGDVMVNLDIKELWDIEVEDNYIAAAYDEVVLRNGASAISFWPLLCRLNGYRYSTYINSGVLVMNLTKIRGLGNFLQDSIDWLKMHIHQPSCGDQDVFNALFYGHIKHLNQRFNRQLCWKMTNDDLSGSIIHTNHRKPWKVFPKMPTDRLYWEIFLRSPWGENVTCEELIDILSNIPEAQLYRRISYKDCVKSILYKVRFSNLRTIAGILFREVLYRLKCRFTRRS